MKKQSEMDAFHGRKEETPDASNAEVSSVSEDGAGGGTRTHTVSPPADFESATSTNSITPAGVFSKRSAPPRFLGKILTQSRRQERTEERTRENLKNSIARNP